MINDLRDTEHPVGTPLPPACETCEHRGERHSSYFRWMVCLHPVAAHLKGNPLEGWRNVRERDCASMRAPDRPCGPSGLLWEPRRSAITRLLDWAGGR